MVVGDRPVHSAITAIVAPAGYSAIVSSVASATWSALALATPALSGRPAGNRHGHGPQTARSRTSHGLGAQPHRFNHSNPARHRPPHPRRPSPSPHRPTSGATAASHGIKVTSAAPRSRPATTSAPPPATVGLGLPERLPDRPPTPPRDGARMARWVIHGASRQRRTRAPRSLSPAARRTLTAPPDRNGLMRAGPD